MLLHELQILVRYLNFIIFDLRGERGKLRSRSSSSLHEKKRLSTCIRNLNRFSMLLAKASMLSRQSRVETLEEFNARLRIKKMEIAAGKVGQATSRKMRCGFQARARERENTHLLSLASSSIVRHILGGRGPSRATGHLRRCNGRSRAFPSGKSNCEKILNPKPQIPNPS